MRNFLAGIFIGAGAILPGISSGVLLCAFRALRKARKFYFKFF